MICVIEWIVVIAIQINRRIKGNDADECRARRRTKAYCRMSRTTTQPCAHRGVELVRIFVWFAIRNCSSITFYFCLSNLLCTALNFLEIRQYSCENLPCSEQIILRINWKFISSQFLMKNQRRNGKYKLPKGFFKFCGNRDFSALQDIGITL